MKRRAVVALFAAVGAGFAVAQAADPPATEQPRSKSVQVTEPAPRQSVIRADGTPMPRQAPIAVSQMAQSAEPAPRQSVVAAEPPSPEPKDTRPIPINTMPREVEPQPVPTDAPPVMMPPPHPSVMDRHPAATGYESHVLDYVSPWTAKGRRCCGSVYMDTPYLWMDLDLTFTFIKHDHAPLEVNRAFKVGANPGNATVANRQVLYNGDNLHDEPFLGGRFEVGGWFDECQFWGFEAGYMFFGAQDQDFAASATGVPGSRGLYMPFFNALTNQEAAFAIADPGNSSGAVRINSRTAFQGADGHFLFSCWRTHSYRVDGLLGFRWLELSEDITIDADSRQFTPQQFDDVPALGVEDKFSTRNDFIGAEIGMKSHHLLSECWTLDVLGRIAMGNTHQRIRYDGFTGVKFPGFDPVVTPTGNFVGPSNIGVFSHDNFSAIPEFGLSVGWQPRRWIRMSLGYNAMFWINVIRPGDQIDRAINPVGVQSRDEFNTGLLIPARPGVPLQQTDFWAQSLSLSTKLMW